MLYVIYLTACWLARILPRRAGYALASFIATVYYKCALHDRSGVQSNVRKILGDKASEKEIAHNVKYIFINFAKYLSDFFRLAPLSKEFIEKNVRIDGKENLDKMLSLKKGVILVSLHLGNWELGGSLLAAMGYPVNAVVLEHKDKKINRIFAARREMNKMRSIPLGMSLKQCFKCLKRGEILAIVGDKDYTSGGVEIPFFGSPAVFPKGAAIFSVRTGAPILVSVVVRERGETYTLIIGEPIYPVLSGDEDKDVIELMGRYLIVFEKLISKYPEQWYIFKPIWQQKTITQ